MQNLFNIRTRREIETAKRIKLAVYAYAYEFQNTSLVSDEEFDRLCKAVDLTIATGRSDLDVWFARNFVPDTGMWIHQHPELNKIAHLYERYYK